ncbi:MAG: thioredoxin family protein [Bacteroidetes bacterium]|nr:thioredoxin family protein [Bacteroidota bacterium]
MIKILLFADTNCTSCKSTEKELKQLVSGRSDVHLVIFRRPEDSERFLEYNIAICPAVFLENKFISYGTPDMRKLESILGMRKGNRSKTKQLNTNLRGESK